MSYLENGAAGITFAETVPAGESGRIEWEVPEDGTVEHVGVRIYSGAENTLQLQVRKQPLSGTSVPVVEQEGKENIDGNDDYHEWHPSHPVEEDSVVFVDYKNTDGVNAHNFRVNVSVDYMGGLERAARGAATALGVI